MSLSAAASITGNPPFNFAQNASSTDYYKVITFTPALDANLTITFTASGGKRFVVWGVNAEEDSSGSQTETHTLTFSASPTAGGTVTVGSSTSGSTTLEEGATVSISATPAELGYAFNNWTYSGTDASVDNTSNASTTFTMGTSDATLTANFSTVNTYTVTYKANGPEAEDVVDTYNEGATATLRPANTFSYSGHSFTEWKTVASGDGTSYDPGDEISNINANHVLFAQWEEVNEVVDELTRDLIGVTGTSYSDWSGKEGISGAVYAGNSAGGNSNSGDCIQIRSNNNNSGIVSTTSGGNVKKVTVSWCAYGNNGLTLNIYGSNTAYENASDLYGDNSGTLLGTIVKGTSTELTINGNYAYVGIRSSSGTIYLNEIDITWVTEGAPAPYFTITNNDELQYNATSGSFNFTVTNSVQGGYTTVGENVDWISEATVVNGNTVTFTTVANPTAGPREGVVTLTYHYGEETKTHDVTVTQTANPNVVDNISSITEVSHNYHVKGQVVATSAKGFIIGDGTGYVYTYLNDAPTQQIGNKLSISGTTGQYGHIIQFTSSATIETVEETNYNGQPVVSVITEVPDYSEGYHLSDYFQFEGGLTKVINGNYTNYYIALGESSICVSYPSDEQITALEALLNKTVCVKGFFTGISNSTGFTVMLESIEAAAVPTYELEIEEPQHGTVTVSIGEQVQTGTDGSYQIPQGSIVTLTATPDAGYRFVNWDADAEVGTVTIENNQFVMPACYVLVQATFELIPVYGYWYTINGVSGAPTEQPEGTEITLDNGTNLNDKFTFAGWTTNPNDVSNILLAGTKVTLDDDMEFTAVYSHTTTIGGSNSKTGEASYVKVTSDLGSDWAGDYLVAYSDYVFADGRIGGRNDDGSIGKANTSVDLNESITDNSIPATVGDTYQVTLEEISEASNTYLLKTQDGKYNYTTTNASGLTCSENKETAAEYPISITFNSEDDIELGLGGAAAGAVFHYNEGASCFRYYKDGGQAAVYLYKKQESSAPATTTTAYYTRVFLNETVAANITIAGPSIIPNGQTLDMGAYTLANTTAANLIIEDGAQLKYSFDGNNNVYATVKKNIAGYGAGNEAAKAGYRLITQPLDYELLRSGDPGDPLIANTGMLTGNYDFYSWDFTQGDEWRNYEAEGSSFNMNNELYGYLYANENDIELNFAGPLSHSTSPVSRYLTVNTEDNYEFNGWYLIGNSFVCNGYLVSAATDGAPLPYYRMNDDGNGFTAVSNGAAIAPMEGIFYQATENRTVYMVSTAPAPSEAGKGNLNISLAQVVTNRGAKGDTDNAIIRFDDGQQLGKFQFNAGSKIYFTQGGNDYAVVCSEARGEMPVNFKAAETGTYTISVEAENLDMDYLHLIDNMTGMDVDLLATPSYTFEGKKSDYASRFKLVFSANADDTEMGDDFAFVSDGNVIILNEGEATLQVIDIMGRVISTQTVNGNASVNNVGAAGVYVLQLINGNNVKTQKIVVK